MKSFLALLAAVAIISLPVAAQALRSAPQPSEAATELPVARDVAYPGVIALHVDTTDLDRKIWRIRQTIPVASEGRFTLLYPEWIPGNHAPRGPIYNYAGLVITANGQPLKWTRDEGTVFAFHVEVPAGVSELEVEAQFLTPTESGHGPTMVTPEMLRLNWYVAALYPAGHFTRRIDFDVTLRLPDGWDYATALETASVDNGVIRFKPVSFETLVDSPLFAGAYMRKWELDPGGRSPVRLNAMGDTLELVSPPDSVIQVFRNLVVQADHLFGARHFDHYEFLLSASDRLATAGIEHQRSSSNGVTSGYFRAWDTAFISKDLIAHEYVHSWNGKYRRPADLWTPHFNTPMRNSLLWVYEGLTQYWGHVLAVRSEFVTKQQALDTLANTAAVFEARIGRNWRSLADTTMDPVIAARRALPWRDWQRSEDYYSEGLLIWLDADTLIRERSGGRASLDNFGRAFFGMNDGDWGQLTYTYADVVDTMNSVHAMDWKSFFDARVDELAVAPMAGIERGGYRLVYRDTPNSVTSAVEARTRSANHSYSIGINVAATGKISAVGWDTPAFAAGLTTAGTITAVNGQPFSQDRLSNAIAATANGPAPINLTIRAGDLTKDVAITYQGGLRYPALERIPGRPDLLDQIFAPR